MSLERPVMSENKEAFLKHTHNSGGGVRGTQEPTKRASHDHSWEILSNKINKVVMNHNLKYKINSP